MSQAGWPESDAEDLALVREVLDGRPEAFRRLVEKYQGPLYGVAFQMLRDRADAEDVVQEAFLRAHGRLESYVPRKAFRYWLFTVLLNGARSRLRWRSRRMRRLFSLDRPVEEERFPSEPGGRPDETEAGVHVAEWARLWEEMVMALAPRYRAPFILRFREGMSLEEVAVVLELPLSSAKTLIYRARRMVARRFTGRVRDLSGDRG